MNLKQKERWEKLRAKGKKHFIWKVGILRIGLVTAIIIIILNGLKIIIEYYPLMSDPSFGYIIQNFVIISFLKSLLIFLISFILMGFIMGHIIWNMNEKRYLNN